MDKNSISSLFSAFIRYAAVTAVIIAACACNKNDVITGKVPPRIIPDSDTGVYTAYTGKPLTIQPRYENVDQSATYTWTMSGTVIGQQPALTYTWEAEGTYYVTLSVRTDGGSATDEMRIEVSTAPVPEILLPIDSDGITILKGSEYAFSPVYLNDTDMTVTWYLDGHRVADTREYTFTASANGTHTLLITAENGFGTARREIRITVADTLPVTLDFPAISYYNASTTRYTYPGRGVYLWPMVSGTDAATLSWSIDGKDTGHTGETYLFTPETPGNYLIGVTTPDGIAATMTVVCVDSREADGVRPGSGSDITVYEYVPAPGQFINDRQLGGMTGAETTREAAQAWAKQRLDSKRTVSLGAFGGYIIMGLGHSISPSGAEYDFSIIANAFSDSSAGEGGNNEPGIVYVMQDVNGNGLPDDEWYELRGSDSNAPDAIARMGITYYRPASAAMPVMWRDSRGTSGSIDYLPDFHDQSSYYPAWITASSYTLYGRCLKAANYQDATTGRWVNPPYGWGYADNLGTDAIDSGNADAEGERNGFKISNAVYPDMTPVQLRYIDFIKVQTGVCAKSGHLGELSTEVCGLL
ncbi:MAG: PKD domain-containing protein [Muribaculaceae bacterium]|nr:PKD domain-containing protein [Muribaculaceae bacterium]